MLYDDRLRLMIKYALAAAIASSAFPAFGGEAEIVRASAVQTGSSWTFQVTLKLAIQAGITMQMPGVW